MRTENSDFNAVYTSYPVFGISYQKPFSQRKLVNPIRGGGGVNLPPLHKIRTKHATGLKFCTVIRHGKVFQKTSKYLGSAPSLDCDNVIIMQILPNLA